MSASCKHVLITLSLVFYQTGTAGKGSRGRNTAVAAAAGAGIYGHTIV